MTKATLLSIFKVALIYTATLFFITPALADRDLPPGADPSSVLIAFFADLKSSLDNPETAGFGLNATYENAQGYWIRSSRESVQRTGQVADLSSVMFFKMNQPASWDVTDIRTAGNFARASVSFAPSASSGVVRERDYDPIETRFDLVSRDGDWFIVDFKGPEIEAPAPAPEALMVDDTDTPETLVTRFMDVVVAELGPTAGSPGSGNLSIVTAKVEDMWLDTNESRRSFGQNLALMTILQPKSWSLIESVVTGDNAEVSVTFESESPMATSGLQDTPTLRFSAQRDGDQWKLGNVLR
jgi:hypothetical protein